MAVIQYQNPNHRMRDELLSHWMQSADQQRQLAEQRKYADQQNEQSQRQNEALNQAKQFLSLRPEQQASLYSQLPPEAQRYVLNPSLIPAAVPTTAEQAASKKAELELAGATHGLQTFPTLPQFAHDAGAYQGAYGAAMPSEIQQADVAQRTLTPEDFTASQRISGGLQMNAKDAALTPSQIKQNEASATASVANAGESRARAGKLGEETITERELRNPESDANKAAAFRAGRTGVNGGPSSKAVTNLENAYQKAQVDQTRIRTQHQSSLQRKQELERQGKANSIPWQIEDRKIRELEAKDAANVQKIQGIEKQLGKLRGPTADITTAPTSSSYDDGIEQRINNAVKAGFTREQAVSRLKEAGVIK